MSKYNKLVRDMIPEIIKSQGLNFKTNILDENNYIKALKNKLNEEINEYQNSSNDKESLEELADVLELMHSLAKVHGASIDEVEKIRIEKAEKRGGFKKRIFLESVED